jgi:integrase
MASAHRKAGCKNYFAFYRDYAGRLRSKSTGETDLRKARKIAEHWEAVARRKIAPSKVRERTNELVREFYKEEVPFTTVGTFIENWLKLKGPEIAQSTYDSYRKSADKFLAFLEDAANGDIALIRPHKIAEFRNNLVEKVSPQTANIDMKFVRAVFRAAEKDGYLSESPAEPVDFFRRASSKSARRTFSVDELRQLIKTADPEWQSMIRFGLYTGQRMGDVARLRWGSVDLGRRLIRLWVTKTGRSIVIPLAPPLRAHIVSVGIGSPDDPIHPQCSAKPSNRLSNEFADLLARAGLRPWRQHVAVGRRLDMTRRHAELSFHCLRHTVATLLEEAGMARAVVQAITGHSSDQMSELYTHVGLEALQKAAAVLPEL